MNNDKARGLSSARDVSSMRTDQMNDKQQGIDFHALSNTLVMAIIIGVVGFIFVFLLTRLTTDAIVLSPNTWECTKVDTDYVDNAIVSKSQIIINEASCVRYTRRGD